MNTRIADRESDYQRQRIKRMLSPEVTLPFSPHAQRSDPYKDSEPVRGYKEVMKEKLLDEEESRVYIRFWRSSRRRKSVRARSGRARRRPRSGTLRRPVLCLCHF